jgi:parvulin-like peptidyl-prolyl isomerase
MRYLLLPVFLLSAPAGPDDVLATYAGGTITRSEYAAWLLGQGQGDDDAERPARLSAMALAESLEAAAVAAGLDRRPQIAFQLAQIERGMLAAALRQQVDQAIVVTDAEVEAELKAEDKERFKPRSVWLRNIFKRVPADAPPAQRAAVRERMAQLRQELVAGADFEQMAWRESDSQTRFRGGAMGYVPPGVLSPAVDRVVATLQKGELSVVLESADGFTILRCDDIAEAREIPVAEARVTIRQGLWSRASLARQAELRADLLKQAAPRYADAPGPAEAAAVVFEGGQVTEEELRWLSGSRTGPPPDARRGVLEEQVVRVVAARRARERGLDADPVLRARAAWQRARQLATAEVTRRINLSLRPPAPAEMRAHFDANRDRYEAALQVDVSVIGWDLGGTPAETRQRFEDAEAVLARVRAGEVSFEEAARRASVLPSAASGGRLGPLTMPEIAPLGPNVFRTIEALAPGAVSGLVQQDKRLFAVKLWERKPARPLTYDEAVERVEKELGDARVAELQKQVQEQANRDLAFALAAAPR